MAYVIFVVLVAIVVWQVARTPSYVQIPGAKYLIRVHPKLLSDQVFGPAVVRAVDEASTENEARLAVYALQRAFHSEGMG